MTRQTDPLQQTLTNLHALRDIRKVVDQIHQLLKNGVPGKAEQDTRYLVLREALLFAPRAGEAITLEWLNMVPAVVQRLGNQAASPASPRVDWTSRGNFSSAPSSRRGTTTGEHREEAD